MDESGPPEEIVHHDMAATSAAPAALSSRRDPVLSALVKRMADGEESALGQLYDETSSLLFALLLRMLRSREDAEEAMLDAYSRAWRNASTFDPSRGSVTAWLVMMARSIAIDRIRASATRLSKTEELIDPAAKPASGPGPEEDAWMGQQRERVQAALRRLPHEQRHAVELAFFSGLSHSELAGAIGAPLGTVKTRVRLGLARLRTLLEDLA